MKRTGGIWSEPELAPFSRGTYTRVNSISPDGRYLFFISTVNPYGDIADRRYTYSELKEVQESIMNGWSNLYWVDTSFVERLRPAG